MLAADSVVVAALAQHALAVASGHVPGGGDDAMAGKVDGLNGRQDTNSFDRLRI